MKARRRTDRSHPAKLAAGSNIRKLFVFDFLMKLSFTAPIWVLYLTDVRDFSMAQITLMEVPLFLLMVFAEVPTGAVADRFGRKTSLAISGALLSVSMAIYANAATFVVIVLSNLAWALAFAFRSGAGEALLYDAMVQAGREDEFQRVNERRVALGSAASLLGLVLGAAIAAATTYSTAIMLTAVAAALAVPFALRLDEDSRPAPANRRAYLQTMAAGARHAWSTPDLRRLFLFSAFVGAGVAAPLALYQQPWLVAHGVPVAHIGAWQAAVQLTGTLTPLAAGWLLLRVGEARAFATLPVVVIVGSLVLGSSGHLWAAPTFMAISAAGAIEGPLLATTINRRIDSAHRATTLSAKSLAGGAIMAVVWPMGGVMADRAGLGRAILTFGLVAGLLAAVALARWFFGTRQVADAASLSRDAG